MRSSQWLTIFGKPHSTLCTLLLALLSSFHVVTGPIVLAPAITERRRHLGAYRSSQRTTAIKAASWRGVNRCRQLPLERQPRWRFARICLGDSGQEGVSIRVLGMAKNVLH